VRSAHPTRLRRVRLTHQEWRLRRALRLLNFPFPVSRQPARLPWIYTVCQKSHLQNYFYAVCQKFFPLIPSPPNGGRGLGQGGAEKTFGNEYRLVAQEKTYGNEFKCPPGPSPAEIRLWET
jgi:hypothetical protein